MQIERKWKKFHLITGNSEIRTPSNLKDPSEPQFIIHVGFAIVLKATQSLLLQTAIACCCRVGVQIVPAIP